MGLFSFGSSKQSQNASSSADSYVDPYQQPFLNIGRGQALGLLQGQGFPVETYAGLNPMQLNILNQQQGFGNRLGTVGSNLLGSGANQGQTAWNRAFSNAMGSGSRGDFAGRQGAMGVGSGLAGRGKGISAATGSGLNSGMVQGLAGMGKTMDAAQNQGLNLSSLNRAIDNDLLSGQIDSASRDVVRNLKEGQLQNIASGAASSGNTGSSRRAVMDAIAERGAADRIGDISSAIRGSAYQTALGKEYERAGQNAALQQAAMSGNVNAYNQLIGQGAGISERQMSGNLARTQGADQFSAGEYNRLLGQGTSAGLNLYGQNLADQRFGTEQMAGLSRDAYDRMATGMGMGTTGYDYRMGVGDRLQDHQQNLQDQAYRYAMGPYSNLDYYMNIIGPPTVLNQAQSTSSSKGGSTSFGFGSG
tara:strand:- start:4701 stop:5954 length:1254 start_codon:yes stop_codon:yes gene_type:complete